MKHKNTPRFSHCDLTVDEAELGIKNQIESNQTLRMIGCQSLSVIIAPNKYRRHSVRTSSPLPFQPLLSFPPSSFPLLPPPAADPHRQLVFPGLSWLLPSLFLLYILFIFHFWLVSPTLILPTSSHPIPPRAQVLCLDRLRSGPTISTSIIRHPPSSSTIHLAQNASTIHFRIR